MNSSEYVEVYMAETEDGADGVVQYLGLEA